MIGERIIKKLIRDNIIDIIGKYVKDTKTRDECIEGVTEIAMELVKIIGVRQIIWYLWYAKKHRILYADKQFGKNSLVTQAMKNVSSINSVAEAQNEQFINGCFEFPKMILCKKCGNKRCPHATDELNECTNSNEPGQEGSRY